MVFAANVLILLVAALHLWFMVLESFLWQKPAGLKAFRLTPESAAQTATLAKNQGVYNGFLAAGLAWGVASGEHSFKQFFLGCVIVAGLVGAATVSKRIFFVQALPAIVALGLLVFG